MDDVSHPAHYRNGPVETIDVIEAWVKHAPDPVLGGLHWNAIKYIGRVWLKDDPLKDLCKARWYLNRLIDKIDSKIKNEPLVEASGQGSRGEGAST